MMYPKITRHCYYLLPFLFLLPLACGKPETLWTLKQLKQENYQEVHYFFDQQNTITSRTPDRFPMYPGGVDAYLHDLEEKIRYTTAARQDRIQGTVVAKYVINREGRIRKVNIMKSLSPSLDRAVIKGLRTLQSRWFPGVINGNAVEVTFIQTFDFSLK